jgi:glutamate-1-semialdehyde 2,1-aminomutase
MNTSLGLYLLGAIAVMILLHKLRARLVLSRAKHPSLGGHGRIARRVAKLVPYYGYSEEQFFSTDGAPEDVV